MRRIRYIKVISALLGLYCFHVSAQEEVPWSANQKLEWKDFKGDVPLGSKAAATTASGISYNFFTFYQRGEMKVDYKVQAFFYPTKSWYRPKVCNDMTLLHEQLHFDISEVFARKMAKEMSETEFTKNIKQEVRSIYKRTLQELDEFQKQYDIETDFSRNSENQRLWQKRISSSLETKKSY